MHADMAHANVIPEVADLFLSAAQHANAHKRTHSRLRIQHEDLVRCNVQRSMHAGRKERGEVQSDFRTDIRGEMYEMQSGELPTSICNSSAGYSGLLQTADSHKASAKHLQRSDCAPQLKRAAIEGNLHCMNGKSRLLQSNIESLIKVWHHMADAGPELFVAALTEHRSRKWYKTTHSFLTHSGPCSSASVDVASTERNFASIRWKRSQLSNSVKHCGLEHDSTNKRILLGLKYFAYIGRKRTSINIIKRNAFSL